jgi:anaerobic dimethyl sulfoxide reductase subunit B (iron-sulfur subunit)
MQHGFFFDQSRCSGCRACTLACKSWHNLPAGPLKYLKIYEYEKGVFPYVRIHFQWIPCFHCEEPACIISCPTGAIYKEEKYGAVLLDSEKCDGCRLCYDACPYGAPVFECDEIGIKAQKCTMCIDRLEMDLKPICVLACPNRALDFGPLNFLMDKYSACRDLEDLPSSQATQPAVVFKPHARKQQLITYNAKRAMELFMRRDPLPEVFKSSDKITEIHRRTVGRNALVIKHKSVDSLMRYTRSDDG